MKLWLKSKSGSMIGVIWKNHPGPILATVAQSPEDANGRRQQRNVYFHNTGMYRGYPVYEETE